MAGNDMYGISQESPSLHAFPSSGLTRAQHSAIQHIAELQRTSVPPPFAAHSQEATDSHRALLGVAHHYSNDGLPAHVGSYERTLVSRPTADDTFVHLAEVLDASNRVYLEEKSSRLLLDSEELGAVFDSGVRVVPYMDSALRTNRSKYLEFVRDLAVANLVSPCGTPAAHVTVFFVKKESGKLRIVVDCRGSNLLFQLAF